MKSMASRSTGSALSLARNSSGCAVTCSKSAVGDVVIDVGDDVGDADDVAFQRESARLRAPAKQFALLPFRMFENAVAHFDGEVQPAAVVLQHFDDAHRLPVVIETALDQFVE